MIPTRTVELSMKSGQIASVEISAQLVEKVREAFNIENINGVTDAHIKYFLIASMKNAAGDSND